MDAVYRKGLEAFKNHVGIKFQLYNSLFTSLPFHRIEKTGILLSLFLNNCEEGYEKGWSPAEIVNDFFRRVATVGSAQEQLDLLFRFVQYIERQVVLFDALEDAAFAEVNDLQGAGTLKHLEAEMQDAAQKKLLLQKLKTFSIHLVLTAHPTQFYPGTVLGIIHDLARALKEDHTLAINSYLQQLGKTPFFKKEKPTPYDEAVSLIWYLENVFYHAAGRIAQFLRHQFAAALPPGHRIISLGFWPGGDRDGNPNVTTDTTLKVAAALRSSILKCYYLDVRKLRRRLTFTGVDQILNVLERKLYDNVFIPGNTTALTAEEILSHLVEIKNLLTSQHNGLFLDLLEGLMAKVELFGLHFATLDLRQESSVHGTVLQAMAEKHLLPENYDQLSEAEKIRILGTVKGRAKADDYEDAFTSDSIRSFAAIAEIQKTNGEAGCHRYIISQCNSALNVMEVYALFRLCGYAEPPVDIIPLFETIDDLQRASHIMQQLYEDENYRQHLKRRRMRQVIMVGFSDGTKDGGYLMANWSIYKAKENLTALSQQFGIEVVFFDGRGGPPARGGGKTHRFYASMGSNIAQDQIQLTIQGQTVSSNFGTVVSAQYNIEQLLNAGLTQALHQKTSTLTATEEDLLNEMATLGYEAYKKLKDRKDFISYLQQVSPLNYYSETNIASRPTKRKQDGSLTLKDLRAIPFVGSWSQLKQNVPGYYGVGTALKMLDESGRLPALKELYQSSLFFATLIDNCEMAMKKLFFPLTAYLKDDPQYGSIWKMIYEEFQLTEAYIFKLTGKTELMANYPVEQLSIQMRERIVLPLTTIQQYGLMQLRQAKQNGQAAVYEKLVIRSSFGIINAVRNSA